MRVVFPLPENRANARWHWRTEVKKKDAYYLRCMVAARPPRAPYERARIRATFYLHNLMDHDNLFSRMKWPQDYLVKAGFIVDDSPAHLEWAGFPEQFIDRKDKRLVIELEPL
jgi:hypothetical protein